MNIAISDKQKIATIKWLTKESGLKPETMHTETATQLYSRYSKALKNKAISQIQLTRLLKTLGFERVSQRFIVDGISSVHKAYRFTGLKPCPTCTQCDTCNGAKFVRETINN